MAGKRKTLKGKINGLLKDLEANGYLKRTPAFIPNYQKDYPQFKVLEDNYETILKECTKLLEFKDQITNLEELGGKKTKGGIHAVKWKSFMLKSGGYIDKNCELCPDTTRLLKQVPRIKQAFFSILDPHQHIQTHKGYYYGFMRYHLGIIIPNNNMNNECWIRINEDKKDNDNYDKSSIIKGEKYFWRNGKGIIFNDNYLHEAYNESDEVRVVLFIDVVRKFPWWFDWFNHLLLTLAFKTKPVRKIAKNAEINFDLKPVMQ